MTVRSRLALTILLTGLATAFGVIVAVAVAFQRFEHESTWQRGDAFLGRVAALHDDLLERQRRDPDEVVELLHNLLLYEPGSQLYLLAGDGTVLASTGRVQLAPGFKVAIAPVREAAAAAGSGDGSRGAYVMGDDPEYMAMDAVVAARALHPALIRRSDAVAGYLYLVCRPPGLPTERGALLRSTLASPALLPVLAVIVLATLLAAWIIATVTRPLRVLSDEVAAAAKAGFSGFAGPTALDGATAAAVPGMTDLAAAADRTAGASPSMSVSASTTSGRADEFDRLRSGFRTLLATLRMQWDELKRLDQFRRESVSNLSHDLRSPLTATVACLETLQQRWAGDPARAVGDDDRRLVEVALRNTRNAAGMVLALGDLALLDEPQFQLHPMRLDLAEVLDDIALRFAERAARQGVALTFAAAAGSPPVAEIDVELFERAIANLLDNALRHTATGGAIVLGASRRGDGGVQVTVADQGSGIAAADIPRLFDRLYQGGGSGSGGNSGKSGKAGDDGKGLGLAIVKRIVELHRGRVAVTSTVGVGTTVTIDLPPAVPAASNTTPDARGSPP